MRLHFPNGEHADTALAEGRITIGSGLNQKLRIAHPEIADAHLAIDLDPVRGIELTVLDPPAELHVNSRPVKHKAIGRIGDLLTLGPVKLLLKPDSDLRESPPPAARNGAESGPQRASLRAVAGQYFGKVIPIRARMVIGSASDCDLVLKEPNLARKHAELENTLHGLYLRDLGSPNGTLVQGLQVRDTVLQHGDQVVFGENRFVIEAPGGTPIDIGGASITPPPSAQPVHTQVQRRLVPPPPLAAAPAPPVPTQVASANSGPIRLANALMVFAALVALGALAFVFWDKFN